MWINTYKRSSWYKSLFKELYFLYRYAVLFVLNGFRSRTVLFYPEYPLYRTEINKVLRRARYNITNNPKLAHEHVVAWQDATFRTEQPLLDELAKQGRVLNFACTDISKKRVEKVFRRVFGYGLAVDPRTHHGLCVRKSNNNAQHDGKIVQCPIDRPESGYIYQRLIDNQVGDNTAGDLRAPVYGSRIPLVFARYRPLDSRFHGDYLEQVRDIDEFLSRDEIARVLQFTREMGLDYGDIDLLRDPKDGRLYIVDVNNTPFSPGHRSRSDVQRAVTRGCEAFFGEFGRGPRASAPATTPPEPETQRATAGR